MTDQPAEIHVIACALCPKITTAHSIHLALSMANAHIQREHGQAMRSITVLFEPPSERTNLQRSDPLEQFLATHSWMSDSGIL